MFGNDNYFLTFIFKNLIILGDLNADCSYLSEKNKAKLQLVTNKSYHWYVPDNADTTTSPTTDCAYDRFIVRGNDLRKRISKVRVFDFEKTYGISYDLVRFLFLTV